MRLICVCYWVVAKGSSVELGEEDRMSFNALFEIFKYLLKSYVETIPRRKQYSVVCSISCLPNVSERKKEKREKICNYVTHYFLVTFCLFEFVVVVVFIVFQMLSASL